MNSNFEINRSYNNVTINKNGIKFSVVKGPDGDIWFNSNGVISLPIDFYSSCNQEEWKIYNIFANLMKSIVGRYILSGDYQDEYSFLPKDFVDLDNKTIIWHSDTNSNNSLELKYSEKEIVVSLDKENDTSDDTIRVRIRTSGSSYENYYQEFQKLFKDLYSYAEHLGEKEISKVEPVKLKKLSFFV